MTGGIIAVYKPKGITSHDAVDAIRKATGVRTVGHAGTLDPLARGVLVIGVGREATKKLHTIVGSDKEYFAEIRLGATSKTDDAEGPITESPTSRIPATEEIKNLLKTFRGIIMQAPPFYSAVKIKGKAAYRYAREGKELSLAPRPVRIDKIEFLSYEWPSVRIRVVTGPGTYIRSLARDIGSTLGTGAYLTDLERTRVGQFTTADTEPLEHIYEKLRAYR